MSTQKFQPGDRCNWVGQKERLIYMGIGTGGSRGWHQFALVQKPGVVWCEVLPEDLGSLELTKQASAVHHPIDPEVSAEMERSHWTPEEALRWYAAGRHYDTVPNGDGTSSARILDTGAVASNALKSLSREYAESKGDVALLEQASAVQQEPGYLDSLIDRLLLPVQAQTERDVVALHEEAAKMLYLQRSCSPQQAKPRADHLPDAGKKIAVDIEAAAKVLAERMDYPWQPMPEQGRQAMRGHAKAVIEAAFGTTGD